MGAAYFYHLPQQPLEAALPRLLEASLKRGWRVAVRGRDPRDHGQAGGPHDALQPVLLTTEAEAPNGATCVMSVEGAQVTAEEVNGLDRGCILFDGGDAAALERARSQWRELTAAGCGAQYWSDESGSWVKKSER